ncbi:LysR substrate-binding domain-containing protein [Aquabacter spiritensis]|uniref:LysR family transcriptional regulator n=1 Tax=Aquabacter spiritensis TaxID=933073 RepID=A0A4R3LN35_9HYPH|nr:LysR substrate-binding domain-containing protein [Aquabacter spiritensis]TCT01511.1 LysR family transcriptional regulator [Aquabacter spiritensis]
MEKLPPLNALRAFVAAGAALSFTKAAAELGVTQAAVSQQIRLLEQHLGSALFVRNHNTLHLTEAGAQLLPRYQDALFAISAVSEAVRARRPPGILRVSALPGFAQCWLLPRLKSFCDTNPDVEVHVLTSHRTGDFPHGDADIAVRVGTVWPGLDATFLMGAEITPACSPQLLARGRGLRSPEDVLHYTRLHSTTDPDDWRTWLAAARVSADDIDRGPRLDSFVLVIGAAVAGLGIGIIRRTLIAEDLAKGRLVAPFSLCVGIPGGWHLLHPPENGRRPEVRRFKDWIIAEAARDSGVSRD